MRVLFTTLGSPSHARAQLPLARAFAAAGHDVLVATSPSLAPVFEQNDIRVATCMRDLTPQGFFAREPAEQDQDGGVPQDPKTRLMSGALTRKLWNEVFPVAQEFRPALILRDGMDLSACLIAEYLGIPQLPTPSGTTNTTDPADVLPGLNVLREEFGLAAQEDPLSLAPHGRIDYVPAAFSFSRHLPAAFSYRQTVTVDRGAVLPQWIAQLPADRPLVLAALGYALPMLQAMKGGGSTQTPFPMPDPAATLRSVIESVSRLEECTVVVATAGIPADTADLPPHVHVTERVPQPLLLECADAFLTHGGFNSIREAMRTATPMAVLAQFGDQFPNADRVEQLGLGRAITERTPDGIATAVRETLADPAVLAGARRARLAMLELPEIDSAVADLNKIA